MALAILREDALTTTTDGLEVRVALPWIRSLPLAALRGLRLSIDGAPVDAVRIRLGDRLVDPADLAAESSWWYLQDRLVLTAGAERGEGPFEIAVEFSLTVPYLPSADGPLELPFRANARLSPGAIAAPGPLAGVESSAPAPADRLPDGWTLAASAFNWTPDVIRADRSALEITTGIVADRVAAVIEVEPGQLWRSFPRPTDAEVDATREALAALGGSVSIVGGSIDEFTPDDRRRSAEERYDFVVPQLRAAARLGAAGIRFPLGQAGEPLLRRLQPLLHDLGLTLFEEAQGQQSPSAEEEAYAVVAGLDDPRVRILVDISMLMPALPVSYLDRLAIGGLPSDLIDRLRDEWRDPATQDAVVAALRGGDVPPQLRTLFMDLIVRFGRSTARDLSPILALVGGIHLKFWDLADRDGRVTQPIRELGAELARAGFRGPLCSEWGGHAWLDSDATTMTRAHLDLARRELAASAGPTASPAAAQPSRL